MKAKALSFYYAASLALLWLMYIAVAAYADTNLPPLDPRLRLAINTLLLNLVFAYFLLVFKGADRISRSEWALYSFSGFALCFMQPVFSGDVNEYLIRGRILALYHQSPYAHVPAEFPNDLLFPKITWTNFPLDYGPLTAWTMTLPALLARGSASGMVFVFKSIQLLCMAACVFIFSALSERVAPESRWKSVLLFCLNPFLIVVSFVDGHNDLMMLTLCVAAAYCLETKKYTRAFLFWTAAFLVKYSVVFLLPFFVLRFIKERIEAKKRFPWAECSKHIALNTAVIVLSYWPLWAGWEKHLVLLQYSKWFYTNSIPYALLKLLAFAKIAVSTDAMALAFSVVFFALYGYCLLRLWKGRSEGKYFYRLLFWGHFAFYFQITAPFHAWYLLWSLPWLVLASWPQRTWQVLLLTLVGLFAYWKRINFLFLGALGVYGIGLAIRTMIRGRHAD